MGKSMKKDKDVFASETMRETVDRMNAEFVQKRFYDMLRHYPMSGLKNSKLEVGAYGEAVIKMIGEDTLPPARLFPHIDDMMTAEQYLTQEQLSQLTGTIARNENAPKANSIYDLPFLSI